MPSIGPLRRMSISTRSGRFVVAASIASRPLSTTASTWHPMPRNVAARSMATIISSSTMTTRVSGMRAPLGRKFDPELRADDAPHFQTSVDLLHQSAHELQAERVDRMQVELRREADAVVADDDDAAVV